MVAEAVRATMGTEDCAVGISLNRWEPWNGVRAVQSGLRIVELPVPLVYLDEKRSFGGALDNAETRLAVYREVLDRALERTPCGR